MHTFNRRKFWGKGFYYLFLTCLFLSIFTKSVSAASGINQTINFQGKLVNSDGTNVSNGTYSIVFSLYTVSSGGSAAWTETDSVTTTDGVFRVGLGGTTTFSSASIDFNSDTYYLGIKVGSDAEMTPRVQFTAVPYAFNAQKVAGLTVTNNGGNTLNIAANKTFTVNNTLGLSGTDGTTFTFPSTSDTVVTLTASQILTNKTIGSTGLTFSGATTDITTGTNEDFDIVPNGTGKIGLFTNGTLGASLDLRANSGTLAIASISGKTSFAGLVVDNSGVGDLFTASSSGLNRFVIKQNGNTGVGTTTPARFVDISAPANTWDNTLGGQLRVLASDSVATAITLSNTSAGGHTFSLGATGASALGGAGSFDIYDHQGNVRFFIDPSGNTGIDTYTPKNTLDVAGNLAVGSYAGVNSAPANSLIVSGNVGIGTTNPGSPLNVKYASANTSAANPALILDNPGTGGSAITGFDIQVNGTTMSRLYADGGADTFLSGDGGGMYLNWNSLTSTPGTLQIGGKTVMGPFTNNLTPLATVDMRSVSGILPIASISGATSFAGLVVDNSGKGDLFTASSSGLPRFTIGQTGNITDTTATAVNFSGAALTVASCTGCGSGTNYWQRVVDSSSNFNVLSPVTIADTFSLGVTGAGANLVPYSGLYIESNSFNTKGNAMVALDQTGSGPIFTASTSGTTKFVIDNAGNVGIGQSTPTSLVDVEQTRTDTSGFFSMMFNQITANPGSSSTAEYLGGWNRVLTSSGLAQNITGAGGLVGLYNEAVHQGTSTIASAYGMQGNVKLTNTGTITQGVGAWYSTQLTAAGTISNAYGSYTSAPSISGGGVITSMAGMAVESLSAATNNSELLLGTGTIPSGNFGIYNASTYPNYFGGNVGIGVTSPLSKLELAGGTTYDAAFATSSALLSTDDANNTGIFNITARGGIEQLGGFDSPFGGIGVYENRVTYSEQFSNAAWTAYCSLPTSIVDNTTNVQAPDGTYTANKSITHATLGCSGQADGYIQNASGGLTAGQAYTVSLWMRGANGNESVQLGVNDTHASSTFILTKTWKRYTYTVPTLTDTSRGLQIRMQTANATYYLWGAQLEKRSYAGVYAATTSTTIVPSSPYTGGLVINATGSAMFAGNGTFAGNVGIGTTTPGSSFELDANLSPSGSDIFGSSTTIHTPNSFSSGGAYAKVVGERLYCFAIYRTAHSRAAG